MGNILNKDKILTVAVIVSIVGISTLYLFSSQQPTRRASVSEIDETMMGTRVVTEGFVSDVSWFSWTVILTLKEEGHPEGLVVAFDREIAENLGEEKLEIREGAKLRVEGKLEEYEGTLNLRVDSMGELSIEKKAYSSVTEIQSLLENPRWYEGMGVGIQGDIIDEENVFNHTTLVISSFEHNDYELTCEIKDWHHEERLIGKPVSVDGYWEYDNNEGLWKLISYDSPSVKGLNGGK